MIENFKKNTRSFFVGLVVMGFFQAQAQSGFFDKAWEHRDSEVKMWISSEKGNTFTIDGKNGQQKVHISGDLTLVELNQYQFVDSRTSCKIGVKFYDQYTLDFQSEHCEAYFGNEKVAGIFQSEDHRDLSELITGVQNDSLNMLFESYLPADYQHILKEDCLAKVITTDSLGNNMFLGGESIERVFDAPLFVAIELNKNWQFYIKTQQGYHIINEKKKYSFSWLNVE